MIKRKLHIFILLAYFFIIPSSYLFSTNNSENIIVKNIIPTIEYDMVEVSDLEDIYKNRDNDYIFHPISLDLKDYSVAERKQLFIDLLLPAIEVVQKEVLNNREIIKKLKLKNEYTESEKEYLENIFSEYKVKFGDFDELESKLIIYPTSLILAQAAIESGWGTSRFFKEGNNLFGIWAFDKNTPHIVAKNSRANFTAKVRKFDNIKDSIKYLTILLSTSNRYKKVREIIENKGTPFQIANGLGSYSETKGKYITVIRNTLKQNNFTKYDKIIPYIVER